MSRVLAFSLVLVFAVSSALHAQAVAPNAALELRNVTARSVWQEGGGKFDVQLRFISNVPAVATAQAGSVAATPEPYACNNHRLDLVGLSGTQPVVVKLTLTPLQGAKLERPLTVAPPTPYPAATPGKVALTVAEPSGKDRTQLPVTGGVPLPKGALYRADNARLLLGSLPLPLQARAESRWEDGSLKWLLLDTQLDLKAGEQAKLTLEYGGNASPKAGSGLKFTDLSGRGGVYVDTGALHVVVPRVGNPELRTATGDKLLAALHGVLTYKDGVVWTFTPEEVNVIETGSLRAIVRVDGHYVSADKKHFLGSTLVTLYAGRPYARVDVLFGNDLVEVVMTPIRSLYLDLTTAAPPVNATLGVVDGAPLVGGPGLSVVQQFDDKFVAEQASAAEGKRLAGWARTDALALAVKDLWQQYPKSLAVTPTGLRLGLCPAITPENLYANKPDEEKLYYYLRDGNYTYRRGMMKRHELWLGTAEQSDEVTALAAQHATITAAPAYYQSVHATGDLLPPNPQHFAMYDEILAAGATSLPAERERSHEYGLMNWGDWFGERGLNWGNEEYDLQVGMLQQYLRSGDVRFFTLGETAARHNTEVDTIHWAAPPTKLPDSTVEPMPGEIWVHSMGHTGGYYPRDYKGMEVYGPGYATNRGHMWTGGNFLYGMLSGDPLVLESAKLAAGWMGGQVTTNFDFGNAREPGWMGMALMSAFRATRDPYYLNAADIIFTKVHEKALATKPEYGLFYHVLSPGHCDCKDTKHYGEAGFMAGVLMSSMKRFYEETGREQVADDIVGIAHFIRDTMWVPEESDFRYTSCPKTTIASGSGGIVDEGMAFAANRSKDEDLREITRLSFGKAMLRLQGSGGGGKSAGYLLHSMPAAMVEIDKFPGPSFDVLYGKLLNESKSPALAALPTLMPNPDFEEGVAGWNTRMGFAVAPTTAVVHDGQQAAKITGTGRNQNEYLVTRYECGPPWEIMGLQPGRQYRLSAWLRVDELTPGTPAPNLRCATRASGQTKTAFQTTSYDLTKMGTWQRLAAEFTVPADTTSAYVAVNMNTKETVTLVMYADDINLMPADGPEQAQYSHPAVTADRAKLGPGVGLVTPKLSGKWQMALLTGKQAGEAVFPIKVTVAGDYALYLRARAQGQPATATLSVDGKPAGQAATTEESWQWLTATGGNQPLVLHLDAGEHQVTVALPAGSKLGVQKVVLSNAIARP